MYFIFAEYMIEYYVRKLCHKKYGGNVFETGKYPQFFNYSTY